MAHIVLAWELGGGYGHLNRLRALAQGLLASGHNLTLAVRYPDAARKVFTGMDVVIVQAPFYSRALPNALEQTPAYVHVLFNVGYGHQDILNRLVAGWFFLLSRLKPDMIIADHSPTALMVSRDMNIPRINFGDGFTCPAPVSPLPVLHSAITTAEVQADECTVLDYCNQALAAQGVSPMNCLADIYKVNETFLITLPTLDHLGYKAQMHYSGVIELQNKGVKPCWPQHQSPKIFAYLKANQSLSTILQVLADQRVSTLVYVKEIPVALKHSFEHVPSLSFSDQPLDISEVLKQASIVVSHGGHQLAAQCLLAGVPQIHIPLHLEQQLLAAKSYETASSLFGRPEEFAGMLSTVINNLSYMTAQAELFADAEHDSYRHSLGRCLALIEHWLSATKPATEETFRAVNAD